MRRDYYLVTLIGFLVGWLVLLPLKNSFHLGLTPFAVAVSVAGFSIFAPIALFVTKFFARFWKIFEQFGKFAAVGTLNTLLDLSVLNLLMVSFGIEKGIFYALFKALSFIVGTTNSYFWNKFWTFGSRLPTSLKEYLRFVLFTLVGTVINVSVASFVVNVVRAPAPLSDIQWANVGALIAVFAAMSWNFLSYKNIVFKNKEL